MKSNLPCNIKNVSQSESNCAAFAAINYSRGEIAVKKILSLNKGWQFCRGGFPPAENAGMQEIDLPHTWNNLDGQDGGGDYFRDACCYMKKIALNKKGNTLYYLEFYGANSVANVYVNGARIGEHRGGYTLFRFDITGALKNGENEIAVEVSNFPFPDVIPLTADFTFFGGIYREVNLVAVSGAHFSLDDHGSAGVYVTYPNTPQVEKRAQVTVRAKIKRAESECKLRVSVSPAGGFAPCAGIDKPDFDAAELADNGSQTVAQAEKDINGENTELKLYVDSPRLWNGRKAPFRYKVQCEILEDGKITDSVERYIGFRWFTIDPQKGFFLNGRRYPLRGVNRHQDRENMGWAITDREHEEDFALIYEMGANAIRLAHYPHHPHFYELCDRYGLLVWAEIPFVENIGGLGLSPLETDQAKDDAVTARMLENAKQQYTELILQQLHRPSIFCWSMSNEVRREYGETAAHMMRALHQLAHRLDPSRYTALATNHYGGDTWDSDIKGCNIYPGWYWGSAKLFRSQAAAHIRANGGRGVAVSEYGAGSNVLHHTERPKQPKDTVCEFHSEEWASVVHEHALKYFMSPKADKIWGAFVWNMFDFAIDSRNEGGIPGRNDKGLVTYDRKIKKDPFYLYKAYWSGEGVLYITSRRFTRREKRRINVKIYSNQKEITLYVNGARAGQKTAKPAPHSHIFVFKRVKLRRGKNEIKAVSDGGMKDVVIWEY